MDLTERKRWEKFDKQCGFPIQPTVTNEPVPDILEQFKTQNVHPYLALYKYDLKTDSLSHSDISRIQAPNNELEMLHLLQETGVIAFPKKCVARGTGFVHVELMR